MNYYEEEIVVNNDTDLIDKKLIDIESLEPIITIEQTEYNIKLQQMKRRLVGYLVFASIGSIVIILVSIFNN